MNDSAFDRLGKRFRCIYRDSENGLLFGVCAGIADYFDFKTATVRLIAVIFLLIAFVPTLVCYLVAALLLKDRPLRPYRATHEREFWMRHRHYGDY